MGSKNEDEIREPFTGNGHLTVQRHLYESIDLVEVWVLERCVWDANTLGEYDVVKFYVAEASEVIHTGIPHRKHRVSGSCPWDEVPEDVRESFINQVDNLIKSTMILGERMDE